MSAIPAQETTPLLTDHQGLPLHVPATQGHGSVPISVRVSNSAFPWPGQRALVFVRGAIFTYLTGLGPVLVHSKLAESAAANQSPWNLLFDFSTISHILQWLWHLASLLWGLKHHHHHHHSTVENDQAWVARTIINLSPPDGLTESSHNHFYPSLLYIAAHVFNFMNTLMYWAVLVPQGHGNLGGAGWLHPFSVVNLYGITSLIASVEVMFLNIIKHEHALSSHGLSTLLLLVGYLGWAAIGHTLTGHYPFFWMDPKEMGSAGLVAACASGFVGMGSAAFAAIHGLTSLREKLAKYASQGGGYHRIHDLEDDDEQPQRPHSESGGPE